MKIKETAEYFPFSSSPESIKLIEMNYYIVYMERKKYKFDKLEWVWIIGLFKSHFSLALNACNYNF